MNKSLAILGMILLLAILLIMGCKTNSTVGPEMEQPPAGVTNEQSAMQQLALQDGFVQNDEQTFDDEAVEPADYETLGLYKPTFEITPLRFGRFIDSITTRVLITVQPGDTTAIALATKNIFGQFKIKALNSAGDTLPIIKKQFHDISTRNIFFKRVSRSVELYWKNWVPVASSLVDGGTVSPNNHIDITKVEMFLPNGDTVTVTDPNNQYLLYRWVWPIRRWHDIRMGVPELNIGDRVRIRVTIQSDQSDTDFVALRLGFDRFHKKRVRLLLVSERPVGGNMFERVFETSWAIHPRLGLFHAGVDAMTKETVRDDTASYSVNWWGVPFRVRM
jgi:hypothetical protein